MNSPYNGKFRVSQQFKGSAHDGLDLVGVDSKEVHSTVNGIVEKAGWFDKGALDENDLAEIQAAIEAQHTVETENDITTK